MCISIELYHIKYIAYIHTEQYQILRKCYVYIYIYIIYIYMYKVHVYIYIVHILCYIVTKYSTSSCNMLQKMVAMDHGPFLATTPLRSDRSAATARPRSCRHTKAGRRSRFPQRKP